MFDCSYSHSSDINYGWTDVFDIWYVILLLLFLILFRRYILASTSARFNDPENTYAIPCDYAFPCSSNEQLNENDMALLSANGCQGRKLC